MRFRLDTVFLLFELILSLFIIAIILAVKTEICESIQLKQTLHPDCPKPTNVILWRKLNSNNEIVTSHLNPLVHANRYLTCKQLEIKDLASNYVILWVLNLMLLNICVCVYRLSGHEFFRTRTCKAVLSVVQLVTIVFALYLLKQDLSDVRVFSVEGDGSIVPSSATKVHLPWNWDWAKITSMGIIIAKILHFIIEHIRPETKIGADKVNVTLFDFSKHYTRMSDKQKPHEEAEETDA